MQIDLPFASIIIMLVDHHTLCEVARKRQTTFLNSILEHKILHLKFSFTLTFIKINKIK